MRLLLYSRFVIAGLALLCTACTSNRFYTPNTMQIPMLTGAGEATVAGGITAGNKNTGWEVQGIYSPLPHIGLMVNHANLRYDGNANTAYSPFFSYETSAYKGHTRLTEGALGGYWQVGPQKEYRLSLFTGFGQGRTENRYSPPPDVQSTETYNSDWRYQRWFVQPALGLKYQKFQVGTGLRFVWVNVYDGSINSRVGALETDRIVLFEASSPVFLTEMAWSVGWRLKAFVISLNSTAVVRGKNSLRDLELASNYVSLTVGLNLHEL